MAEKDIQLKQVLKRFPPGDRWTPADADKPVFANLTEGIEWVFQSTQERDYVIKAGEGKVFIYHEDSTRFAWYGVVGMTILVILLSLLGGCATTQETSKDCCKSKKTTEKCD
jgi:hypothetical protein